MPQPLARIRPDATLVLDVDSGPSTHRPDIALLAMRVISEWSRLEEARQALFVETLGGNPKPAARMFSALSGSAAKEAALKAVAALALQGEEAEVFAAIDSLYRSAAKSRNRVAHWVW